MQRLPRDFAEAVAEADAEAGAEDEGSQALEDIFASSAAAEVAAEAAAKAYETTLARVEAMIAEGCEADKNSRGADGVVSQLFP